MSKNIKRMLALFLSFAGVVMSLYVGGYLLFLQPLISLYHHYLNNTITMHYLFVIFIKVFFAATAGGGVWCIFDIIAGFFRDNKKEE